MPYPQNLETARAVEDIVRAHGAVPATIAVLDGRCIVGLSAAELERLARLGAGQVRKVSRRDLAHVVALGAHGSTTVSATMLLAALAGIRVFVTGGIGGVHRGGQDSLDISADLAELARTPVAVVCAGVKSILDIGRTLEVLETAGVTVGTLGPAGCAFPAFFSADSGHASPLCWAGEEEAAAAVHAALQLRLGSGQLVCAPIPPEHAAAGARVEAAIQRALGDASAAAISGAATTPYLLARVAELTDGDSLRANMALIRNNAAAGARLACALMRRVRAPAEAYAAISARAPPPRPLLVRAIGGAPPAPSAAPSARALVVGGIVADLTARPLPSRPLVRGTSNPGTIGLSAGGVGRNVAEALARLGSPAVLGSAVGDDALGALALAECARAGVDTTHVRTVRGARTATYAALHDADGELAAAVADMVIFDAALDAGWAADVAAAALGVRTASGVRDDGLCGLVLADANLSAAALGALGRVCAARAVPLFLEPVSVPKAAALAAAGALRGVHTLFPNADELMAIAGALHGRGERRGAPAEGGAGQPDAALEAAARAVLAHGVSRVVATRGARGVLLAARAEPGDSPTSAPRIEYYPAHPVRAVECTSGAGDCLAAGFTAACLRGLPEAECVRVGLAAAALSVQCAGAVSPALTPELLLVPVGRGPLDA